MPPADHFAVAASCRRYMHAQVFEDRGYGYAGLVPPHDITRPPTGAASFLTLR